jgi:hypothetical protein
MAESADGGAGKGAAGDEFGRVHGHRGTLDQDRDHGHGGGAGPFHLIGGGSGDFW